MSDSISDETKKFALQLHGEVTSAARGQSDTRGGDVASTAQFMEEAFTAWSIDILSEVGAVDDGHVSYFDKKLGTSNVKVNGYSVVESADDVRIDLFVCAFRGTGELYPLTTAEVRQTFDRGLAFFGRAIKGLYEMMERSDPAWDMAQRLHELYTSGKVSRLQLILLSDGYAPGGRQYKKPVKIKGNEKFEIRAEIWELERLCRSARSGQAREVIEIDFVEEFGEGLPCLPVTAGEGDYGAYLAVFPARVLHQLYDDYGERLLEMNVRSFLQARGKVNKGIRETILKAPHLFFAYNNGITAVAEDVCLEQLPDGRPGIRSVKGLQIVNGGQTTASIHRAAKKDRAELDKVFVQMKLSQVKAELLNELVPQISLFANSQNKVSDADFSANDPFHLKLEEMSRTVWTPGGTSLWFYERARGQFQVARSDAGRKTDAFDATHPKSQFFSKTDLAYFEHSWGQLPHQVSKGAQKNFREFTLALKKRSKQLTIDDRYFKDLIAKAIIFRETQKLAKEAGIGAYRANIVTYTVAYFASRAGGSLDLTEIWTRQKVADPTRQALEGLLKPMESAIKAGAGDKNVTEWCKKEGSWDHVRSLELPFPRALLDVA